MRSSRGGWLAALALVASCTPGQTVVPDPVSQATPSPPAPMVPTPPCEPTVGVVQDGWQVHGLNFHRDPVGNLRVFMEISHDGPGDVEAIEVAIRLRGGDGTQEWERIVSPLLDLATPGQWVPVVAVFAPEVDFVKHQVEIRGRPAEGLVPRLHPAITTREVSHAVGAYVAQEVKGMVVNDGVRAASNLRIVAVCYDAAGRVVAAGSTAPEVSTLLPRYSAAFTVNLLDLGGEVFTCKAEAQGMVATAG